MARTAMRALLVAAVAAVALAANKYKPGLKYGDYQSSSEVEAHANITLDVEEAMAAYDNGGGDPDYAGIKKIYQDGKNSKKDGDKLRTLQGMAKHEDLVKKENEFAKKFVDMYSKDWLDTYQLATLNGDGIMKGESDGIRKISGKKNLICLTTMYSAREMYDAINEINAEEAMHAWDEAVAFWYGPSTTVASSYNQGLPTSRQVSEKRDKDFGTTTAKKVMAEFEKGLTAAKTFDAAGKAAMIKSFKEIQRLWTITFLQATVKYSWKMQKGNPVADKDWGEGYTYWRCMSGMVHGADLDVADEIEKQLTVNNDKPRGDVHCKVVHQLNKVYQKLGITADDMGKMADIEKANPCKDWVPYGTYGSYTAATDVFAHANITVDVDDAMIALDKKEPDYETARDLYMFGKNSKKSSGKFRTLQGMATHKDLLKYAFPKKFESMYGKNWLDTYQLAALRGTGIFKGKSAPIRVLAAKKNMICLTTQYSAREMDDALNKGSSADAAHAWDEAVAFWYGPTDVVSETYNRGLPTSRQVSEKRDKDFGTTTTKKVMAEFVKGLTAATKFDAAGKTAMKAAYDEIQRLWTITFLQATVKYSYKMQTVKPLPEKEWSEGYTYWRCMSGYLYEGNEEAVNKIEKLMTTDQDSVDANVHCLVMNALKPLVEKFKITEADMGKFKDMKTDPCTGTGGASTGAPKDPNETKAASASVVAPLFAALVALAAVVA